MLVQHQFLGDLAEVAAVAKLEGEFPSAVHSVTFDLFQLGGLAAYQLAPPLDVFQNVWLLPDADQEPAPHDCIQGIEDAEDALGRPFLLIFCRGDCERHRGC